MIKYIILIIFFFLDYKFLIFYYNLCFFLVFILFFIVRFKYSGGVNIGSYLGVDSYRFILIILRVWIIGLICMRIVNEYRYLKIFLFILILLILIIGFARKNLLIFYFFFEIRLIPTFILVIYIGRNPERLIAGFYILIYTLLISIPLLVYLFKIYFILGSLRFKVCNYYYNDGNLLSVGKYFIILIAFLIKIPIYFFHIWLPKAHVEAPVYGSILLAGVLLKLGRYGLIRILILLKVIKYNYYYFSIGLIGGLIVRIFCLIQVDIKILVAYSSVVHINIIIRALITIREVGVLGAYILIIAHGLCSSCIFYIVNFFYVRTGRRLLIMNKGLGRVISSVILLWLIVCIINFSFPFSLNFIREVIMMISIIIWDIIAISILILIRFFRRAYSLYLFSYVFHGEIFFFNKFNRGKIFEYLVIIFHLCPLLLILLNLDLL